MTVWSRDIERAVLQALREVDYAEPNREHLGRPFITAYQVALKVDRIYPQLADTLGVDIGGQGTGRHTSLAQYLARELSQRIKDPSRNFGIEGAQLSSVDMVELSFRRPDGELLRSSNIDSRYDLSMFRLREQPEKRSAS
jgi:hypothetical protein